MICLIITKYFLLHLNIVNNLKLTAEIGQRSHAVWHMCRKLLGLILGAFFITKYDMAAAQAV